MSLILSLFFSKLTFFSKAVRDRDIALLLVTGAFFVVGALVAASVFIFLYHGFLFLEVQEVFGPALTVYTLEAGFAFVFALLLLTSVSSGLMIFFHSDELPFLVSHSVSPATLFYYGLLKNYIISNWPVFVLAFPAILALGRAYHEPLHFYIVGILGILVGAFGTVVLGSAIAFVMGYLIPRITKIYVVGILVSLILIITYLFSNTLVPVNFQDMFRAELLEEEVVSPVDVEKNFSFWPSHHYVNLLRAFLAENSGGAIKNFLIVTGGVILIVLVMGMWAAKVYGKLWTKFQERTFIASGGTKQGRLKKRTVPPRFLSGDTGLIINKDFLVLSRNFNNLYAVGFPLFLLLVYGIIISRVVGGEPGLSPIRLSLVLSATIAVMGYFASILSLRFVFPAISQEGHGAWITWSSPFNLKKIVLAKWLFFGFVFSFLLLGLFLFSIRALAGDTEILLFLSLVIVLVVLTINGVSLGIGAAFPNFHYFDAERLSTTPGGLAVIFISIIYISVTSFSVYLFLRPFLESGTLFLSPLIFGGVFSLGLLFAFLRLALNKIHYIG